MALTIAGSDSGGGAGIQADLKTFADWGVHGTTALACITAQNPTVVKAIAPLGCGMVRAQIQAVVEAFPVAAVKTGLLFTGAVIETVADCLRRAGTPNLVVDPVMVAGSGAGLLSDNALAVLRRDLIPMATVVTPNVPEAEVLSGLTITNHREQAEAARRIAGEFGVACVVTGGHLLPALAEDTEQELVDVLVDAGGKVHQSRGKAVRVQESHGTGCTFTAALAAALAFKCNLPVAVNLASRYVAGALTAAQTTGDHYPLGRPANLQAILADK